MGDVSAALNQIPAWLSHLRCTPRLRSVLSWHASLPEYCKLNRNNTFSRTWHRGRAKAMSYEMKRENVWHSEQLYEYPMIIFSYLSVRGVWTSLSPMPRYSKPYSNLASAILTVRPCVGSLELGLKSNLSWLSHSNDSVVAASAS